ncbi:hypothetical protein MMIC_P1915 [Mariprofundus micogutta]|uniref:Uncharacterized protein n=1 Tax=Mariprofundus micogutta TaxID=1921010 RepID=A0A1L8CPW2_9PROT|nr:hypothetical protein [Mariprofundus micogutta]GAV20937.1 hypothetical protein MMIC_P1915 [Mariprofundus micogutta]
MKHSSVMLHALSLNDRMLEPSQLPVSGHVWAYDKAEASREEFVGNCMSMLSFLDIHDAEISWEDDIMAFDVTRRGSPVTIIISLTDDSLASDYFYFFGIWSRSSIAQIFERDLNEPSIWQDEGLLMPAMNYAVNVAAEPMQLPVMKETIGSELFAQRLYDDAFYLCGFTEAYPIPSGSFVICPTTHASNHSSQEIRHALYSLRNLMALMSCVMRIYDRLSEDNSVARLYKQMLLLMERMDAPQIESDEWDALARENGRISFALAAEVMRCRNLENEVRALQRLFDAIHSELHATEMQGLAALVPRMLVPFDLIADIFTDRFNMIERSEKQTRILQPLMHSRMLAAQQILLEKLVVNNKNKEVERC